jgi:hypothetical protein
LGFLDSYASQDEDRRPRLLRIVGGAVGALVLIILLLSTDHERVRPARSDDRVSAWVFSEKFISRKLESPSTAEFCGYNAAQVTSAGDDSWKVICWVDTPGDTGELHRSNYTTVLQKHGDLWSLQRLTLTKQ